MPNYSGFTPQRPFGSFIEGLGAGSQLQQSALRNEASRAALDQQKQQRETAGQFAATGDPRVLRGYDPALAVTIENNLATMDTHKQEAAMKRLTAGIDITDKALPYIVAASKSNPQQAASMWPEYIADLRKVGIQPPPFMEQFSPEALEGVMRQKEDLKTAVARINAASRDRVAAGNQAARIYAADAGKEGRIEAAKIGSTRPGGTGGTGATRFPSYMDYKADVRAGRINGLSVDADEDTMIRGFNAANSGGKAAGQAEHPKPPKPLTPMDEMLDKAVNPQKYAPGGQPSAAGVQPVAPAKSVRPYVVRDKSGQDVTNTLSDADYNAVLQKRGLR